MIINNASDFKLGGTQVQKVYDGSTLVWPTNQNPDIPLSYISTGNEGAVNNVFFDLGYYVSTKTYVEMTIGIPSNFTRAFNAPIIGTYRQEEGYDTNQKLKFSLYSNKTSRYNNTFTFYYGRIYENNTIDTTVGPTSNYAQGMYPIRMYLTGRNGPTANLAVDDDGWERYEGTPATNELYNHKLVLFKDGDLSTAATTPGGLMLYSLVIKEWQYAPFTPGAYINDNYTTIVHNFVPVLHYYSKSWNGTIPANIIHTPGYYPVLYDTVTRNYYPFGGNFTPGYAIKNT